ncbi:hypothetical protein R3P38DRAFT_2960366 [Favolaschia claudopus]|uniref:F-box domain-containing protein n=1 Tax=Favolaschia claudopus TaxID=2862362 RepID=A0AAW0B982_9AGAR
MSSRNQLLQHIDELSSAIEDLEIRRLVPMSRLPVELLSQIFKLCPRAFHRSQEAEEGYSHPNPLLAPLLLLGVCRLWRDIVISCPSFWNAIDLQYSYKMDEGIDAAHLATWLGRAPKPLPLSLCFRGRFTDDAQRVVQQYSVHSLHLRDMTIAKLPPMLASLNALQLYRCSGITIADCIDGLRAGGAPHLEKLSIGSIDNETSTAPLLHVSLSSLRTLDLRRDDWQQEQGTNEPCPSHMLRYLTLPALQNLTLSYSSTAYSDLTGFFARSSPPLFFLEISGFEEASEIELGYLRPVSANLSTLAIECRQNYGMAPICDKFVANAKLFRNLRHLTLMNAGYPHGFNQLLAFVADCAGRHRHFESARFIFSKGNIPQVIREQFRVSTQGGTVHVHLGCWGEEENQIQCMCSHCH